MPILGFSNLAVNKGTMSKSEQMGRKQLSDWIENIVGKGEVACYEQFLLFPRFQTLSVTDVLKRESME